MAGFDSDLDSSGKQTSYNIIYLLKLATMAKNKVPRDPNAPKRNISAYLLYQNAQRNTFMQANPGMTFGQLAKYTSAMYAELPPEEKDVWKRRAEDDKARYGRELAAYVPAAGELFIKIYLFLREANCC